MVHLERLTKSFRGKMALENLTLAVPSGEIFGLLGHNGAGKSTTFGLLLGQVHPDRGEAFIRGVSVQRDRRRALQGVGAIFETPGFYDYLSGRENLAIFTSFSGRLKAEQIAEVVALVGLTERIRDRVGAYSHGMRQRLALAQALLPQPELILLDEPMDGLDPQGMHEMRDLIRRLSRDRGITVLLASHLLAEVEQLCDRVAILHAGRLVFQGAWAGVESARFRIRVDDWEKARPILTQLGAQVIEPQLVALAPPLESAAVIEALVRGGLRVHTVEPVRRTLEEFYLGQLSAS
ncbi:MAG: ABC transporter ATP-binding protein [Chthoniobacteraceae bacterium]